MSKPYPSLKAAEARQKLTITPIRLPGSNVFVADLSGQINLEWLFFWEANVFDATLNYCIFSDKYFTFEHFPDDSPLANIFKAQLPPNLPGIYLIELIPNRLRIFLAYGDIFENLTAYLKHPQQERHQHLDGFNFDAWVIGNKVFSKEIDALINGKELALSSQKKMKNAPWCFGQTLAKKRQKTIIIGAGLAGACLARTLAEGGRKVILLEKEDRIASHASGNRYAVLYPKLALYDAPLTNLLHQSYPFALSYYRQHIGNNKTLGEFYPLKQKLNDDILEMKTFIEASPHWFQIQDDELLFHHSLVLDMPALCQSLIQHQNIELRLNETVTDCLFDETEFQINGIRADEVVICNGYLAKQFKETGFLDLKGMRGQMTHIRPVHHEAKIFCNDGHFLPLRDNMHALGASFNPNDLSLRETLIDHEKNLQPWMTIFGKENKLEILSAWVGVRGVSQDHLPIVGFVPDEAKFLDAYRLWQHHANLTMDSLMPNVPGLYVFSGFGARGLLTIPYLAHYLKALMSKETFLMPAKLSQALSPARFLKKKLSRSR